MNTGWYMVYILMVFINQIMCYSQDFNILTWQNWVWSVMLILCFVAGDKYR